MALQIYELSKANTPKMRRALNEKVTRKSSEKMEESKEITHITFVHVSTTTTVTYRNN
jgi:hypothetical protein